MFVQQHEEKIVERLHVAHVMPQVLPTPPHKGTYGGVEAIAAYLCEEKHRMGINVTAFVPKGSEVVATRVVESAPYPLWSNPSLTEREIRRYHLELYRQVFSVADQFHVIFFHAWFHLEDDEFRRMMEPYLSKCITVLHGPTEGMSDEWRRRVSGLSLVSISESQRRGFWDASWVANIYHGLDPENYPRPTVRVLDPEESTGDFLLFLGRMHWTKGCDEAIRIANLADIPLKIAARIRGEEEEEFFAREVEPHLGSHIQFVGEADHRMKVGLLRKAKAFLFPIKWPEPFGIVQIEAMACGCPLIAYPEGSVPEVFHETGNSVGFMVRDPQEAAARIRNDLWQINRFEVRRQFERCFSTRRMAESYITLARRFAWGRLQIAA